MLILQGSYRNEGNFTFKSLESSRNRLRNWHNVAALRHQIHSTLQSDNQRLDNDKTISLYATSQAIIEAIDDDLGTPAALRIIDDAFSKITNSKSTNIDRPSFVQLLETIDTTLGLQLIDTTPDISDDIKSIILERKNARIQKDWKKSDELRNQLLTQNIIIRDSEQDSIWEYKN
jgi:cysteinyl-tRNA synthetase